MTHHVTVPLVVAKQADGSDLYLYAGAPVPSSVPEGEVARLVEGGFIAEAVEAVEIPEGAPTADWKVPQIDAFAAREGIDLSSASNKAEKLALLGVK